MCVRRHREVSKSPRNCSGLFRARNGMMLLLEGSVLGGEVLRSMGWGLPRDPPLGPPAHFFFFFLFKGRGQRPRLSMEGGKVTM